MPFVTDTVVPPAPTLRLNPGDGYCEVYWDDDPEHTPDPLTGALDLEAYRIWRADNWDRPFGSSIINGPESTLWQLIDEYDLVNSYITRRVVNNITYLGRKEAALVEPLGHRDELLG